MHYFKHICNKDELLQYESMILSLFQECFGRTLESDMWKWLYLQNPTGNPIVNLAFLDNKLVGHCAFIPIRTNQYNVYVSITMMVSEAGRKNGLFFELAQRSYVYAQKLQCDIIIGFPNKNSSPVLRGLLQWKIEDFFIIKTHSHYFQQQEASVYLDTSNNDFMQWRLSKPNANYIVETNGLILKEYNNDLDVVYAHSQTVLESSKRLYNVLTNDTALKAHKIIDYPFGYRILNPLIKNPTFKIDLLMSDVF